MDRSSNRGMLVAFVGVDGSGKSSVVNELVKPGFLKTNRVKVAYLGNKSSWTPIRGRDDQPKKAGLKTKVLLALTVLHAKLRILPVIWARFRGKIVLCDRYYYDQNIMDPTEKYIKNKQLKGIVNPFIQWIPLTPDITFYLQVKPEIAYARKKDFRIEKVRKVCRLYDEYLLPRPEVVAIDANQPFDKVIKTVRSKLAQVAGLPK